MLLKTHLFSRELQSCTDEDLLCMFYYTADHKFFAELFARYADLAYRICLKYLKDIDASKDQVMQIFCQLLEKCRARILKIENFKSWLLVCIRNECTTYRRAHSKKTRQIEKYTIFVTAHPPHDIIDFFIREEQRKLIPTRQEIIQALHKLPVAQRQCLQFFFYEKKSYRSIARLLDIPVKKVKSHIQNGKRNMRKILG